MTQTRQRQSGSTERPTLDGFPSDLGSAGKDDVLDLARRFSVDFIRLQFTDILGVNKNVEVPRSQFAKALDGWLRRNLRRACRRIRRIGRLRRGRTS